MSPFSAAVAMAKSMDSTSNKAAVLHGCLCHGWVVAENMKKSGTDEDEGVDREEEREEREESQEQENSIELILPLRVSTLSDDTVVNMGRRGLISP